MRRLCAAALCLLLLSGCGQVSLAAEAADAPAASDITLTVGRRLPLPVTKESLRAYYGSPEGFDRRIAALWGWEEGFCVCSAARGGGSPETAFRFDWVFAGSGICYSPIGGPLRSPDGDRRLPRQNFRGTG